MQRRVAIFVVMLLVTLAADQGTKAWAHTLPTQPADCTAAQLAGRECHGIPQPVIAGFWDWELALNDGAAFSNFRGAQVVLSLVAMAALVMIGVMAWRTKPEQRLQRVAYALVAGGALGNLIDRLRDGAVTDFVRWRFHEHRWPIFNVADVALVIGIALLLLESIAAKRRAGTLAT